MTYVCGGSGSGSKYYDASNIKGGRYWKNVVHDANEPVFGLLEVKDGVLVYKSYAKNDQELYEIDSFRLVSD